MRGSAVKPEPSTKRSYAALFNPKRLGLGLPFVSSSSESVQPRAESSSLTKRAGERSARAPTAVRLIEFTSPFGNALDVDLATPATAHEERRAGLGRRLSSEDRARLANGARAIVALATTPGKRRKSVVDLEAVTDGMQRASVAGRRRSSLTPLGQPSVGARSSFARLTPLDSTAASPDASTTASTLPRLLSGLSATFPLVFPSPRSPLPVSPVSDRRTAFFDEVATPGTDSSSFPRSPSTFASPVSPYLASAAASIASSSSYRSFEPRSPRTADGPDFAPDELEPTLEFLRSPSGVNIRFPLVFPSRPTSVHTRSSAASTSSRASSAYDEASTLNAPRTVEQDEDDGADGLVALVADVLERSEATTRTIPSFTSPFPPPFLSPSKRTVTADSFSKLTFPSMPTLFPDSVTIPSSSARRRPSAASSYHGEHVSTPSTFGPRRSATETGFTVKMHDIFAEAFGACQQGDESGEA
ncbi:hypothetical protein JCM3775_006643 [Rhodotorula graminis]|uniref:Uncharacterized protein n=1 Tax=Rhodotorula graminis (strain WP1) TaxID=578459 RepID=A0A194S314_RHOGW|nr:uncharacterized protein RHOBADRAFT_53824 [Rhodotorula graminis WP1]KPV74895.1 hypothetical protein RHOBADRAFT_53824 [Rhodotorula graminis WP1]